MVSQYLGKNFAAKCLTLTLKNGEICQIPRTHKERPFDFASSFNLLRIFLATSTPSSDKNWNGSENPNEQPLINQYNTEGLKILQLNTNYWILSWFPISSDPLRYCPIDDLLKKPSSFWSNVKIFFEKIKNNGDLQVI